MSRSPAFRGLIAVVCLLSATSPSAAASEYEIGPADVLNVVVLGQAPMSGEMAVDGDGMLNFPFLGRVKASGLSPSELERKLITLLSDGYLKRPQVSVSVKQYRSQRVFVTGEVLRPGPYGLRPDRSLLTLLQDVGDLTPNVGHEVIVIRAPPPAPWTPIPPEAPSAEVAPPAAEPEPEPVPAPPMVEPVGEDRSNGHDEDKPKKKKDRDKKAREKEEREKAEREKAEREKEEREKEAAPEAVAPTPAPTPTPLARALYPGEVAGSQIFRLNLRDIRSGYPDKDMQLEVGDTVYLPKAAQFYVSGHVARPGAFRYEEGLTVFQALALAGNPTERGSNKVKLIRLVDGRRKELRPKLSDPVLPEDTLHVPERFF
jgi:polysaccharide export outer membrane protein